MDFPTKNLHVMRDTEGVIVARDTSTWETVLTLPERESDSSSVSWSPDGHTIASGHQDGTISLWDVESRTEYRRMAGHASRVTQVSWSGDGYHLATASADGSIRLWDAETGQKLQEFSGRRDAVHATTWSADGMRIVSPRQPIYDQDVVPESLHYDGELPPNMITRYPTADDRYTTDAQELGWMFLALIAAGWFFMFVIFIIG